MPAIQIEGPEWSKLVEQRTRDFLSLDNVAMPLDMTIRAQHRDGRSGSLLLNASSSPQGRLRLSVDQQQTWFETVDAFVSAGWAVSGRLIEPWVGSQYGSPHNAFGGRKVLLLGESTHDAHLKLGEARADLTSQTVFAFLDGADWHFYKRVTEALRLAASNAPGESARTPSDLKASLWQSVAFSNVVPVVAASYPGERPSTALFHTCSPFLNQIFDDLKPDVVLVFGKSAWGWLRWALLHNRAAWDQEAGPLFVKQAKCNFVIHPRAGMSPAAASRTLVELLN